MNNSKCAHCAHCDEIKYDGFFCDMTGYIEDKLIEDDCPDFEVDTFKAEPVRHGMWVAVSAFDACGGDYEAWMAHGNPTAYHYCSECKNEAYVNEEGKEILSDYCPFCGADLRDEVC